MRQGHGWTNDAFALAARMSISTSRVQTPLMLIKLSVGFDLVGVVTLNPYGTDVDHVLATCLRRGHLLLCISHYHHPDCGKHSRKL